MQHGRVVDLANFGYSATLAARVREERRNCAAFLSTRASRLLRILIRITEYQFHAALEINLDYWTNDLYYFVLAVVLILVLVVFCTHLV